MEVNKNESPTPAENTQSDLENHTPRDGFDNTGTQGYDSLQDAGYTGTGTNERNSGEKSGTGSSSEDFHEVPSKENDAISEEDRALDAGI